MTATTPRHRLPPDADTISGDKYVFQIQNMHAQIRGKINRETGQQIGPILHAIRNVPGFNSPASEWGEEHIVRFQAIIMEDQRPGRMFPAQYVPKLDDATMTKLRADDFFGPTEQDVRRGFWKSETYYTSFFLDLMHLLIDASPPVLSIPSTRAPPPRETKPAAKIAIKRIIDEDEFRRPESPTISGAMSPTSIFSADTAGTKSLIYWGPRETSTHSLFRNLLKALACVEFDNSKTKDHFWLPS
jgi:hypothetical protein